MDPTSKEKKESKNKSEVKKKNQLTQLQSNIYSQHFVILCMGPDTHKKNAKLILKASYLAFTFHFKVKFTFNVMVYVLMQCCIPYFIFCFLFTKLAKNVHHLWFSTSKFVCIYASQTYTLIWMNICDSCCFCYARLQLGFCSH